MAKIAFLALQFSARETSQPPQSCALKKTGLPKIKSVKIQAWIWKSSWSPTLCHEAIGIYACWRKQNQFSSGVQFLGPYGQTYTGSTHWTQWVKQKKIRWGWKWNMVGGRNRRGTGGKGMGMNLIKAHCMYAWNSLKKWKTLTNHWAI